MTTRTMIASSPPRIGASPCTAKLAKRLLYGGQDLCFAGARSTSTVQPFSKRYRTTPTTNLASPRCRLVSVTPPETGTSKPGWVVWWLLEGGSFAHGRERAQPVVRRGDCGDRRRAGNGLLVVHRGNEDGPRWRRLRRPPLPCAV